MRRFFLIDNKLTGENKEMADRVEDSFRKTMNHVPLMRVGLSEAFYSGREHRLYDIKEELTVHLADWGD